MKRQEREPANPSKHQRTLLSASYEQQLAARLAQQHQADNIRFGVPLWALCHPGPRQYIEDDEWIEEEEVLP
jgi:hypothetical protein